MAEDIMKGFLSGGSSSGLTSSVSFSGSIEDGTNPTTVVALLEDGDKKDAEQENREMSPVASFVRQKFEDARTKRISDEQRWLASYRNYRGIYGPDVVFSDREKSRAFIKVTKTKVLAAYAKIVDVLFAGNKFPVGIEPTPVIEGDVAESVHFDPKDKSEAKPEEQSELTAQGINTITRQSILEALGPVRAALSRIPETETKVKEGPGLTPSSYTWEPAKEAARLMEKLIHDQLLESDANKHLRAFVFEMCLFGTGCMKGPLAKDKEYPRWTEDGDYDPVIKTIPESMQVSIWDLYPDPAARRDGDAEYMIQRHRMSRTDLRALKKRPHFRPESIELAIEGGASYTNEYWEDVLKDYETRETLPTRYEVLEYWGTIDKEIAERASIEIPDEFEDFDEVQVNIWVCNNQILRFVLNPFTPARIPYYTCPYELNPYSFFGIGVAENMMDTQLVMNGFIRMTIDNAALSGNLVFEIDETNLVPGQSMDVYPGKVFRRQAGAPGQAIFATAYPNTTQQNLLVFDKMRQLADEATGIPSYAHGISGVMSTGRTASGMSMLMGAADQNIKAVVRNIDDYLLIPWGKGLFQFNMQFNFDPKYIGDLDVVARGTESLMRNEIRSQKLLQFLQITANPMDAPFVKRDYILRELAASMDLEADKVVNDPREAAIQAEMMRELNQKQGVDPAQLEAQKQQGNPAGAPSPQDPTGNGGGNIAPGQPQIPGGEGFQGTPRPQEQQV